MMLDIEKLLDAIRMQESGGNQNAVSPAGARTAYGIMPATASDPGYGLKPADINSLVKDEDASRNFARDYLTAMYNKTGNWNAALAAYNGGLKRGIAYNNGGKLPAETAGYVPSVMKHYNSAATPTAERVRFDELTTKYRPQQTASLLGTQGDMTQGMDTSQVNTGGMQPIEDDSIKNQFINQQGIGMKPEAPMDISPSAQGPTPGSDPDTPEDMPVPQQADASGGGNWLNRIFPGDENTSKMGLFERMRQPGNREMLLRLGAGIAAGASKGWGAGLGAGFEGAADALDRQRELDLKQQALNFENIDARVAYPLLREHFTKLGDPDADRKAAIVAFTNPKAAAEVMGVKTGEENFGVNPEYFTTPEGKIILGQYGDRGTQRFTDLEGNEVKGDQLKGLKRDTAIKPIDLPTETVIVDRSGAVLARFPKDNAKAAEQKGLGEEQAKAQAALPAVRSNAEKIKSMIQGVLGDKEQLAKFTGWGGWLPNITPGAKEFEKKLTQLDKRSFMMAFESLKGAGAITEAEGAAATAAMARLSDLKISDPGYVDALQDFANEVDRLQQIVELKATGQWTGGTQLDRAYPTGGAGAPAAPAPSGITIKRIN